MQIIINIPKNRYEEILQGDYIPDGNFRRDIIKAIRNGISLSKGHEILYDTDALLRKYTEFEAYPFMFDDM